MYRVVNREPLRKQQNARRIDRLLARTSLQAKKEEARKTKRRSLDECRIHDLNKLARFRYGRDFVLPDMLASSKPCMASSIQQRIAFMGNQSASAPLEQSQQQAMPLTVAPSSSQPENKPGNGQATVVQNPAAHSEIDVFLRAVGFALTGSDDVDPKVVGGRANCVFAITNARSSDSEGVYHLNNVQTDRIRIQGWKRQWPAYLEQWIAVELNGDEVVFEKTTEQPKDDGSSLTRELRAIHPDMFNPHHYTYKETELHLMTNDQDRVKRAWDYIYSHGCTGKRSPF